jgi:hypothetical protein
LLKRHPQSLDFLDAWWQIHDGADVRLPTSHYDRGCLMDGPAAIALLGGADPLNPSTWVAGFNAINGCPANHCRRLRDFPNTHHPIDDERAQRAHKAISDRWRPYCHVWPQGRLNAYPWTLKDGDFILHFVGESKNLLMPHYRDLVDHYPSSDKAKIG